MRPQNSELKELKNFTFNFSPLGNPSRPMYNATKPGALKGRRFYVNLCTTSHDTSSCYFEMNNSIKVPIPSMACMEDCHSGKCIAYSLGKTIGFLLNEKGNITLQVTNGDVCEHDTSRRRTALVHLTCNHTSGVGNPLVRLPVNDTCRVEYDWVTQYACPICTEECYEHQETSCGNNGHRMVLRALVQPCWGGTVDPESSSPQKCYLTYVIVGSIVVVSFILIVVFFILRMHHERVRTTREVYSSQLKRHLYRLSTTGEDGEEYILDSDDEQS